MPSPPRLNAGILSRRQIDWIFLIGLRSTQARKNPGSGTSALKGFERPTYPGAGAWVVTIETWKPELVARWLAPAYASKELACSRAGAVAASGPAQHAGNNALSRNLQRQMRSKSMQIMSLRSRVAEAERRLSDDAGATLERRQSVERKAASAVVCCPVRGWHSRLTRRSAAITKPKA